MQELPKIEGISPGMLWTALYVLIGICLIVITVYKVIEILRKEHERKQEKLAKGDVTVKGQLADIANKLDEITAFMQEANERFDRDNRRLNALEKDKEDISRDIRDVKNGIRALCQSSLAHLSHDITGNHVESLRNAEGVIHEYLTDHLKGE